MYAAAIGFVVAGSWCYHVSTRLIDPRVPAPVSLGVTYGLALPFVVAIAAWDQKTGRALASSFAYVNWTQAGMAAGAVLIEFGYLLAYRAGGRVSTSSVLATTLASLLLIPAGVYLFSERLSWMNVLGIAFALVGIALIGYR
jgi:drug/metabolite transporter (DMT)-like permease